MRTSCLFTLSLFALTCHATAVPEPRIHLDAEGVLRWRASGDEVALFGANYCPFSAGDYRLAKRVGADIRKLIDMDMAHFARMGWDGMRLCTWGDWESSDLDGNRIDDEHMQLMDYQIKRAGERGISMLLTPIHAYSPRFADQIGNPDYRPSGFSSRVERRQMGTDPGSIAAQANYIGQVLNHVNPHTGLALKDDPAIPFVEMMNEPVHNSGDPAQAIGYINTLTEAVTGTGSRQITFHNLSQDPAIAPALARAKVQGVSFGWYPSGLNAGRTQQGNFLHTVESFPSLLDPLLAKRPRLVYEFDQADMLSGYMFPAMVRTMRSVGAQFAAIFAYDTLATAQYNLSWQTHFVNLVHSPRKAISGVIAAEAMRRLPRMRSYGAYPASTRFGDFSVDYATDSSTLNAPDAFMHAGDTSVAPRQPARLERIAGFGSSPLVSYQGTGAYFLDKIGDGLWRLELYPNSVHVSEPFLLPQPGKTVSRLYFNAWPMTLKLADLGAAYTATPLVTPGSPAAEARRAQAGSFAAEPGVWILSRAGAIDQARLPATINRVSLREYHVNAPETYPDLVRNLTPAEVAQGDQVTIRVQLASAVHPAPLKLYYRRVGGHFAQPVRMRHARGYEYHAKLDQLAPGHYDFIVLQGEGEGALAFPGQDRGEPGRWPFSASATWQVTVAPPRMPLELFNARRDIGMLSWVRPSEIDRTAGHSLNLGESSASAALALRVPDLQAGEARLHQYAGGLYIGDRIAARGNAAAGASKLSVRLKTGAGSGKHKTLDLLLIEKDGSSWRAQAKASAQWSTVELDLASLRFDRSIFTPTPYPGTWSYWREGPAARAAGPIRPQDVERLELRVHRNEGAYSADDAGVVEVESVWLHF